MTRLFEGLIIFFPGDEHVLFCLFSERNLEKKPSLNQLNIHQNTMNKESTENVDTNSNGIAIQLLDHQINDLEYSTHYHNICCAGTMNYSGWYHDGDLYLLHLNKSSTTGANRLNVFNKLKNRTGVHALTWSEHYIQTILCGNHDGSMLLCEHGDQLTPL